MSCGDKVKMMTYLVFPANYARKLRDCKSIIACASQIGLWMDMPIAKRLVGYYNSPLHFQKINKRIKQSTLAI